MGFSKYPKSLDDNTSLPVSVDLVTPVKAEVVNRLRDALLAVESELGLDPSRLYATVRARLDALEARIRALELKAIDEVVIPISSGIEITESDTFASVGAGVINPTSLGYPNTTVTLEVILQTTNSSFAASFELFNITEGILVSHLAISTVATVPTLFQIALTIGGADFPSGQDNVLEGRIRLASGAPASDRAISKYVALRSKPAD